ncbi:hypothetical protein THAOC_02655 [Thalassiosira oceanica]|uniref:Uncharacterized protein n=1 Tax=Thalassiosira oceanica TaxID=159749 RepID=K0TA84_THAOC|nr:hypothetical protein THAOC_02655 [Thalassiosira oceanica]|eukprot:EJK75618.1 hypothetical protein THAOC_02655 [Thalassiosira oceanica]
MGSSGSTVQWPAGLRALGDSLPFHLLAFDFSRQGSSSGSSDGIKSRPVYRNLMLKQGQPQPAERRKRLSEIYVPRAGRTLRHVSEAIGRRRRGRRQRDGPRAYPPRADRRPLPHPRPRPRRHPRAAAGGSQGMVGQHRARRAVGVVSRMISEGKVSWLGVPSCGGCRAGIFRNRRRGHHAPRTPSVSFLTPLSLSACTGMSGSKFSL